MRWGVPSLGAYEAASGGYGGYVHSGSAQIMPSGKQYE
jgi:hypothetical protein